MMRIKAMFTGYFREDTPIFRVEGGRIYRMFGNVHDSAETQNATKQVDGCEISDIVNGSAEGPLEVGDEDIVEVMGLGDSKKKTDRFDESVEYNKIFLQRDELGLNVDYFTRTSRRGEVRQDLRYRRRQKAGVAGGWVSKDYVKEAVSALTEYDRLVESDNVSDLKKAADIAVKYFTKEAKENVRERIAKRYSELLVKKGDWQSLRKAEDTVKRYVRGPDRDNVLSLVERHMEREAVELSGWAASREIDYNTAVQTYAFLIKTGKPSNVAKAVEIAKAYVPKAVVATVNYLQKVSRLHSPNSRSVPQLPPHPSLPDMYADVPDSGVYRKGEYGARVPEESFRVSRSTPPPLPRIVRIGAARRPLPVPKLPPRPQVPRLILPAYGVAMSA
ncbi:hypothetical protein JW898_05100 [Candidatus Woesearchaeota archaeon]|nr:hypothetical protein [Candidatus Woesearchaeota archaeon]